MFWALAVRDIKDACDVFAPVFEASGGRDGYVSLEVDPTLAYETLQTFREAIDLHETVDKPNLLVKIPATKPGLAAIEDVIATWPLDQRDADLLPAPLRRGRRVLHPRTRAPGRGRRRSAQGGVGGELLRLAHRHRGRPAPGSDVGFGGGGRGCPGGRGRNELKGKLAVANARLAYEHYKSTFAGARWEFLAGKGATPQRVLWASTSTKNPAYPDTLYVDDLIGPDTVNTMPQQTIDAYQDHGDPKPRLEQDLDEAHALIDKLAAVGVSYEDVTDTLEREGVEKFSDSFYAAAGRPAHQAGGARVRLTCIRLILRPPDLPPHEYGIGISTAICSGPDGNASAWSVNTR